MDKKSLFSRLQDVIETDVLSNRVVTVVGLGTGGSLVAVELAKCAVGKFRLIDFDRLETHNVVRHACGVRDLGRLKTDAVKDAVLNCNPFASVELYNLNVLDEGVDLAQLLSGSDIVMACTDSERSKYHINRCLINLWFEQKISIPAIYAGAYERAFGGDVMRVVPGASPCYDCVIGSVQQLPFMATMPKSTVPYSALENSAAFRAEPGLGLDVHFIALLQAKLALMTLLRGTDTQVADIPYDFLFWGNRKEWIFPEPFKCIFAKTEMRPDCGTCGTPARAATPTEEQDLQQKSQEIICAAAKAGADTNSTVNGYEEVELAPHLREYSS